MEAEPAAQRAAREEHAQGVPRPVLEERVRLRGAAPRDGMLVLVVGAVVSNEVLDFIV